MYTVVVLMELPLCINAAQFKLFTVETKVNLLSINCLCIFLLHCNLKFLMFGNYVCSHNPSRAVFFPLKCQHKQESLTQSGIWYCYNNYITFVTIITIVIIIIAIDYKKCCYCSTIFIRGQKLLLSHKLHLIFL
jgi:hypothetical protein